MQDTSDAIPQPDEPEYSAAEWRYLVDYLCGEGEPAIRAAVEERLANNSAFAAFAAPLLAAWQVPIVQPTWDVEAGWTTLQHRRTPRPADPVLPDPQPYRPQTLSQSHRTWWSGWWSSGRSRWVALATAACVLLILGRALLAPLFLIQNRYRGGATGATVTLPDGSVATLAPGSYLTTERGFPQTSRQLHLFGDAQFHVVPNPHVPFVVEALGVGTRVLGTTFHLHVDTLPLVRIDVSEGAVAVVIRDAAGRWRPVQVLTAGQAVHVPLLARFITHAGAELRRAGVPPTEAMSLISALRRALIQAGTAAATNQAQHHSAVR